MQIYIASSWKNQHAVEMLTVELEKRGHTVVSFVRAAIDSETAKGLRFDVNEWIASEDGAKKFKYDTDGATTSDLVIYIGPSGEDAAAECGMAWASGIPILGLFAKGTSLGLMRRMMYKWCYTHYELLDEVEILTTTNRRGEDEPRICSK